MEQCGANGMDVSGAAAEAESAGAVRPGGPSLGLRSLPCAFTRNACCSSQQDYPGVPGSLDDVVFAAAGRVCLRVPEALHPARVRTFGLGERWCEVHCAIRVGAFACVKRVYFQ